MSDMGFSAIDLPRRDCDTIRMPSEDVAYDKNSRKKFNKQATESLHLHQDDLAQYKHIARDAALDLKLRKKYRGKRADAARTKKKAA